MGRRHQGDRLSRGTGKGSGLVVSTSADTGCWVLSGFGSGPDVLCGLGFDRA